MSHTDLLARQQRLLARSELLRESLANQSHVIQRPLALADQVRDGMQWLYGHPQWPIAAVTVLIVLKPSRVLTWGGRIWWGWTSFKKAQKLLNR
jgi:hypothetical protein